jgi:hypothetical protein
VSLVLVALAGMILGAALLLVGQWWGTRLSAWRLESSTNYLEAAKTVSQMARQTASHWARESRTGESLSGMAKDLSQVSERIESLDRLLLSMWEYLKTEAAISGRRPRSLQTPMEPERTPPPMPRIETRPVWASPAGSLSQESPAAESTAPGRPS